MKQPIALMDVVPGDDVEPNIWEEYRQALRTETKSEYSFEFVERYDFYERSKEAYAIVATGEKAQYANIILKKRGHIAINSLRDF